MKGPVPILLPGQLKLSARCHAVIFSTSPRRELPRLHLSGQARISTPELGPHSDLISHGCLLPGLVMVLVGCDSCFLTQRWLPLSYCQQRDWKSGGNWRQALIETGKNEVWDS